MAFYSSSLSLNPACCAAIEMLYITHLYLLKQIFPSANIFSLSFKPERRKIVFLA